MTKKNSYRLLIAKSAAVLLVFLLAAMSFAAEPRPFFALCMDTHDAKRRSIEEQNAMLKELGYDGVAQLVLKELPERAASAKKHGLKVNQVYLFVNLSKNPPFDAELADVLPCIKGGETQLAVLVAGAKPSDIEQDDKIIGILRQIKTIADPLGVPVVLYPHINDCVERVEDAVRIAEKLQKEEPAQKIGVMFNLCHWAAKDKSENLESVLNLAKPYLAAVSINGLDTPEEIQAKKGNWIQPLDSGSFDIAVLLQLLDKVEYRGAIGLQCYGISGDAKIHLTRSMNAWKKLNGKDSDAARKYPFFGQRLEQADTKQVSGIYPSLAMFNDESECGTGAVVPWAGHLWAITYGPHSPHGSSDKLYEITPELEQIIRSESVGGTHANRLIHRESKQLIIGPYFIDEQRNVRVVPPKVMPGRLTATARHLTDSVNKVYFTTMEEGLYEVDVNTLAVKNFIKDGNSIKKGYTDETNLSAFESQLPGYHGKGSYSGQGRLVYANNGDRDKRVETDPTTPSGALAEWYPDNAVPGTAVKQNGDWQLVRRNQFTEVTGPGGIAGNELPDTDPIWSIGWDYRSLILTVLHESKWSAYRLPKASHTYDGAHGWHTEWPRIRDIGEDSLLMTMHGTFWKFPKNFTPKNSAGIEPRSTYLKVIGDFCRWNDRIVFGCDDSAKAEFYNQRKVKGNLSGPGRSQSNLWFVKPEQLDQFGPKIGSGGPWMHDTVKANEYSEPYLFTGYAHRQLFLRHNSEAVTVSVEIDAKGDGNYQVFKTVAVPAEGTFITFDKDVPGVWIRLKTDKDARDMTAMFHYRSEDNRTKQYAEKFDGLAQLGDENICGGVMLARGGDFKTLRLVAKNILGEFGPFDLDGNLTLTKQNDPEGLKWTKEHAAIPADVLQSDEASVLLVDEKGRWRLPKGDKRRDKLGMLGEERICREVSTERDLLHVHGTFYELPAENAGGIQKIRPIASHPFRIKDYASYRGMLVLSGLSHEAPRDNPHIIAIAKSELPFFGVWCGVIDDLWELGKPRGIGGPWKDSEVKAGEPSDPYLMTGYDKKRVELSHHSTEPVAFRIELDVCGDGQWSAWKTVNVAANQTEKLDIPVDAYWVRLIADKPANVSAVFVYE